MFVMLDVSPEVGGGGALGLLILVMKYGGPLIEYFTERSRQRSYKNIPRSPGLPVPDDQHPDDKYGKRISQTVEAVGPAETQHRAELRRRDSRNELLEGALAQCRQESALKSQRIAELEEQLASALSGHTAPVSEPPPVLELSLTPFNVIEEDDRTTGRPGPLPDETTPVVGKAKPRKT